MTNNQDGNHVANNIFTDDLNRDGKDCKFSQNSQSGTIYHESMLACSQDYNEAREFSLLLASYLNEEDVQLQSMPDASPTKWHLAHTTWFFETFILKKYSPDYSEYNNNYGLIFNSYYNVIGEQFTRSQRGLLSRPRLVDICAYRKYVDHFIKITIDHISVNSNQSLVLEFEWLMTLGIQHEKQHQELLLMDIKHAFFQNPIRPEVFSGGSIGSIRDNLYKLNSNYLDSNYKDSWTCFNQGLRKIGNSSSGFCFDNESPEHDYFVQAFKISNYLVSNQQYMEFINDGGYRRSEFWLADGWSWVQENNITMPLYWERGKNNEVSCFTLYGQSELNLHQPVCHLSYYEASAYAAWGGCRLPTEMEWEVAANLSSSQQVKYNLNTPQLGNINHFQPQYSSLMGDTVMSNTVMSEQSDLNIVESRATEKDTHFLRDFLGSVWQWTSSSYSAYPGFKPFSGSAGEYNGKFMSGQFVLRGGACVTPDKHVRNTYRNFYYAHQRWMFSGLRLAKDV